MKRKQKTISTTLAYKSVNFLSTILFKYVTIFLLVDYREKKQQKKYKTF